MNLHFHVEYGMLPTARIPVKEVFMRRFCLLFSLLMLLFSVFSAACAEVKPAKVYEAPKQIVITFAGDCTIGCTPTQRNSASGFEAVVKKEGYQYPFARMKRLFSGDDLTVVNLEGVFYNHEANRVRKTYNFRAPTSFVKVLQLGSIEAVSIANNHIYDYGIRGQQVTVETLNKAKIGWFGTTENTRKTFVYKKDGIKIGFMAVYDRFYNGANNREFALNAVKKLKRDGCQVVIACLHGGVEYQLWHDRSQENIAHALTAAGADIVIGHHPHVIEGIEVKNGRTILWSLGNFVFGGNPRIKTPETQHTYVARFTFSFDEKSTYLGHQLNIIPCHMSGEMDYNNYQPHMVQARYAREVLQQIQDDTKGLKLKPYIKGVGAIQEFVKAPKK